jgi:polyvinyl alcohol dehydrogenase (cytochrome)
MARQGKDRIAGRGRLLALLAAAALPLALPASAPAADPWPSDGATPFNIRWNNSGPSAARAAQNTLVKVWQKTLDGDVTGTPILRGDGAVYVGTWSGTVYQLSVTTGQILWARYVGLPNVSGANPVPGSLLLANGTLYAVVSHQSHPALVALDPDTGLIKWSVELDNQANADAWGSPAYSPKKNLVYVPICACKAEQDRVNVNVFRGNVVAVDATSGAVVWKTHTVGLGRTGGAVQGTPAVYDGIDRLFVGTGQAFTAPADPNTDALLALDTGTGAIVGSFQAKENDFSPNSALEPTSKLGFVAAPNGLVGTGGRVLIGAGARNGTYYTVDPTTMGAVNASVVGAGSSYGGVIGSSAFDGGKVYGVSSTPSAFWSLAPKTGALMWAFPGTVQYGSVSASRGVVWSVDATGFLNANNAGDGKAISRTPLLGPSTGGAALGFSRVIASIGTTRGTGGGVAAFK